MLAKILILSSLILTLATGQTPINSSSTVAGQTATATISLTWVPKLAVTLTCPNLQQISGTVQTCTVTINQPAPVGGAIVTFTSGDPTKFTVPATATIPAGSSMANFVVTAL